MTTRPKFKTAPATWFSVLNFLTLGAVFGARLARDAALLSLPGSEYALPAILLLNAFIITWVGGRFNRWAGSLGATRLGALAALLSCGFVVSFAGWGNVWLSELPTNASWGNPAIWAASGFYLLTEIPIFLAVNLVWVIADPHFTEQEFQRAGPKIAGWGALGIAGSTGLIWALGAGSAMWVCAGCFAVLSAWLWTGRGWGAPASAAGQGSTDEPSPEGFLTGLKTEWTWAKGQAFVRLFILATIANFVLLGSFEQTVANGASHLGYDAARLSGVLAIFICCFGIGGAFFQWFGFTWLLRRFGAARLNLFAPAFMMLGALILALAASDFLQPLWQKFGGRRDQTLLFNLVLGARLCGWVAEYLFNQAMLPLVYGALPTEKGLRARFFIEGPVTAITNGALGLVLLAYFTLFKQETDEYGYKMDLLFVVVAVLSGFMWWWSKRMVPEFPKVLREKVAFRLGRSVRHRPGEGLTETLHALPGGAGGTARHISSAIGEVNTAAATQDRTRFIEQARRWLQSPDLSYEAARSLLRHLGNAGLDGVETAATFLRERLEERSAAERIRWHIAALDAGSIKSLQPVLESPDALPLELDWGRIIRAGVPSSSAGLLLEKLTQNASRTNFQDGAVELLKQHPHLTKKLAEIIDEQPPGERSRGLFAILAKTAAERTTDEPGSAGWLAARMTGPAQAIDRAAVNACYELACKEDGSWPPQQHEMALESARSELRRAVESYKDNGGRQPGAWQEVRAALSTFLQLQVCQKPELAPVLPPELAFRLLGEQRSLADHAAWSSALRDNAVTVLEQSNIPRKDFNLIKSLIAPLVPPSG